MWKRLDHPNIVPFKGVTFEPLQLVSEWMHGGELREYIKNNHHANQISLVGPFLSPSSIPYRVLSCWALPKASVTSIRAV